jgi:hypothetical protein
MIGLSLKDVKGQQQHSTIEPAPSAGFSFEQTMKKQQTFKWQGKDKS